MQIHQINVCCLSTNVNDQIKAAVRATIRYSFFFFWLDFANRKWISYRNIKLINTSFNKKSTHICVHKSFYAKALTSFQSNYIFLMGLLSLSCCYFYVFFLSLSNWNSCLKTTGADDKPFYLFFCLIFDSWAWQNKSAVKWHI